MELLLFAAGSGLLGIILGLFRVEVVKATDKTRYGLKEVRKSFRITLNR